MKWWLHYSMILLLFSILIDVCRATKDVRRSARTESVIVRQVAVPARRGFSKLKSGEGGEGAYCGDEAYRFYGQGLASFFDIQ
ncbi:hypothetical protein [Planifilum fimeticola]|uniref:hypothetical protein n=1 Tax=Planifilum fimeticola TaxID=201975 RepID=UPI0011B24EE8|nr:hypothetical protein [Planifilum fimeticola]